LNQEEEKKGNPLPSNASVSRVKQGQVDSLAGSLEESKGSVRKERGVKKLHWPNQLRADKLESIKENSNEVSRLSSMDDACLDIKLGLNESFQNCINKSNDSVSSVSPDNSRKFRVNKGLI